MKKNNIEINLLTIILIETIILLFFFKESFLNIIISWILSLFTIPLINKIKKNKLIDMIIIIITSFILIILLKEITTFITFNLLKNYSNIIIMITIIMISFIITNNGYHPFIKTLEIASYFYLLIKIISFILITPNINVNNFNEQLINELTINSNIIYILGTFIITLILIKYTTNKLPNKKIYLVSLINPIIIKLISILVIGKTLFNLYNYPYINTLKRIKYLDFIERMEGILSLEYLFCFFLTISFTLFIIRNIIHNKKNS